MPSADLVVAEREHEHRADELDPPRRVAEHVERRVVVQVAQREALAGRDAGDLEHGIAGVREPVEHLELVG